MAVLTGDQFAQKWAGKFADNQIQNIDEAMLRAFRLDIRDSFVTVEEAGDVASSVHFLSEDEAVLSPINRVKLTAGKLYWLVKATTPAPPTPPPPPPTTGQRQAVALTGLVADGQLNANQEFIHGTDNSAALLATQQQLTDGVSFHLQPAYELSAPAGTGIIGASDTKYLLGYRNFILDLGGNTFIPIYAGTDNFFMATVYRPEALQINGKTYVGTKFYLTAPLIDTVQPGATEVVVKAASRQLLDPAVYFVGARMAPYSKEKVLGTNAYPPGTVHNETPRTITAIDYQTGVIKFTPALEYEHRDDNPENPQTVAGGSGRGRLLPLDDPRNPYKDFAEFRNGKMFASSVKAPGAMAYVANEVVYRHITMNRGSTPTESLTSTLYEDCDIEDEIEGDKLTGRTIFRRTTVRGFISNFGGCRTMEYEGGYIGASAQVACPVVSFTGTECWARPFYTDSGTRLKSSDPAVASYVGFHETDSFTVDSLRLGASPECGTSAYLAPAEYREVPITAVNADGEAGSYWDGGENSAAAFLWRGAQKGTRFYTLDGTKVGRAASAVRFVADSAAGTSGTFWFKPEGFVPAVGDVYEFSNVLNVIDKGNHTVLTPSHPARLFSEDTLAWKDNTGTTGVPGTLTLTKADLLFRRGGPIAWFALRGKPRRISVTAATAAPSGRLLLVGGNKAQQAPSYVELVSFGLTVTGTRFAGTAGSSASMTTTAANSVGLNQYRPAGFGKWAYSLALVFDGLSYADIPDDLTITLETDFL